MRLWYLSRGFDAGGVMASDKKETHYEAAQALKDKYTKELDSLEKRISRLRVLYDQYFMGIERLEPLHLRNDIKKTMRRSEILKRGSTVLKFRYRSLQQRFTSYGSYWDRIVRMIEEGQIRRGVSQQAGTLPKEKEPPKDGEQRFAPAESLRSKRRRFKAREDNSVAAAAASAAQQLTGGKPPAPKPVPSDFLPADIDGLYGRLLDEKKRAGENTAKLTRDVVANSIKAITEKVAGREVRFRVISKDGKVSLTAVLKKN
jgi:hypothetical protein